MRRLSLFAAALCAIIVLFGTASAQKEAVKQADVKEEDGKEADVLEGVLRVHPKFHYRFFINGFGDGQMCALFNAGDSLKKIEPGTTIRVRGKLASKYFGNQSDQPSALISTWIVYMNVDEVEVLRKVEARGNDGPAPQP